MGLVLSPRSANVCICNHADTKLGVFKLGHDGAIGQGMVPIHGRGAGDDLFRESKANG